MCGECQKLFLCHAYLCLYLETVGVSLFLPAVSANDHGDSAFSGVRRGLPTYSTAAAAVQFTHRFCFCFSGPTRPVTFTVKCPYDSFLIQTSVEY